MPPGLSEPQGHAFPLSQASSKRAVRLNISELPHLCAAGPSAKMAIHAPAHLPSSSHSTSVCGTTVACPPLLGVGVLGEPDRHRHSPCAQGADPQMPPPPENLSPSEAALNILGCPPPPAAKLGCSTSACPTGQWAPGDRDCVSPPSCPHCLKRGLAYSRCLRNSLFKCTDEWVRVNVLARYTAGAQYWATLARSGPAQGQEPERRSLFLQFDAEFTHMLTHRHAHAHACAFTHLFTHLWACIHMCAHTCNSFPWSGVR